MLSVVPVRMSLATLFLQDSGTTYQFSGVSNVLLDSFTIESIVAETGVMTGLLLLLQARVARISIATAKKIANLFFNVSSYAEILGYFIL